MTIDERTRHHRPRLEPMLGPAGADALIAHLPTVGWAVATRPHPDDRLVPRGQLAAAAVRPAG